MAGIDMIDVPYKGGGQALVDLLGGQVNLSLIVAGNGIKQARAGKLVGAGDHQPDAQRPGPGGADLRRERLSGVLAAQLVRDHGAGRNAARRAWRACRARSAW